MKIGFIGQGWIGKNYADNFEKRGYNIVRYDVTDEYKDNKDKIKECDIVFVAVPTPSTPEGFDYSIVEGVLPLVGEHKIAVIKSTILPGTTESLQKKFPNIFLMHSPEFLTEATVKFDVAHPKRNIVGYVHDCDYGKALDVIEVLPLAPYKSIVPVKVAEMIKYGGNCWFYFKVVYMNLLYDLCKEMDIDYELVKEGMSWDNRIGFTHLEVEHQGGRGAGGHCFIKDFAAFTKMYDEHCAGDATGRILLGNIEKKNIALLKYSNKSIDLLIGVYGDKIAKASK